MFGKASAFFRLLPSLPKTVYYNFILFPIGKAIHLPVLFHWSVKLRGLHRGTVSINDNCIRHFTIRIGFEGTSSLPGNKSFIQISGKGKLVFDGKTVLSKGIYIRNSGVIEFGSNFFSNNNLQLFCCSKVSFGRDDLLGWNIHIRDCDGHPIYQNGKIINPSFPVIVGNYVWIGQDVKILKGVAIPSHCVVAMNSCVTKPFDKENVIIGGYPAKIIKDKITWEV